jgi:hypothetical protein
VLRQPVSQTPVADGDARRTADARRMMDHQVVELLERVRVAEERAAYAEQHATYASEHAAYAEQQLAMQAAEAASVLPEPEFAYVEPDPPARRSAFATWSGWCLAIASVGLAAAGYLMSYQPLRAQLAAQTKLVDLQTSQRTEAEAALRANFESERKVLKEALATASAATAAPPSPTEALDARAKREPADPADHAATSKAAKLEARVEARAAKQEARAAKHEAFLAKKAERAAKREERLANHKEHTATTATAKKTVATAKKSESDEPSTAEPKQKAKPAAADTGGEASNNDPLEGL